MKTFLSSCVIAAAAGLALATAGTAAAGEPEYFTALTDYGYGDTTQEVALNVGTAVCQDVAAGVPESETIQKIYDGTNDAVDAGDAAFLYNAALAYLC